MSDDNRLGFAGTLVLGICIVFMVLIIAYPAYQASEGVKEARTIADEIKQTFKFTPEIIINGIVVVQQENTVPDVGSVAQSFNHNYNWSYEWLGSTKTITINGTHEARVGFDLEKKIEIRITGKRVVVVMPEPGLISVEPLDEIKFESNNGLWEWENDHDRNKAITAFNEDAQKYAEEEAYPDVKETTEAEMTRILSAHGKEVEFRYRDSGKKKLKVKEVARNRASA